MSIQLFLAQNEKIMSTCIVLSSFVYSDILYENVLMIFKYLPFLDMLEIYYINTKQSI